MNLQIKTTISFPAPVGTKIITADDWITLARKKRNGDVWIITKHKNDIGAINLFDDDSWTVLYPNEVKILAKMCRIK